MKRVTSIIIFMTVLSFLFSCKTTEAENTIPQPDVPFVDKSETVGVSRVIIKIPYGTKVATLTGVGQKKYIEWQSSTIKNFEQFKEISERNLRNFGYNIIEEDLFQTSTSAKARYQIGGIVKTFSAAYKGNAAAGCLFGYAGAQTGGSSIELEAEFQLYDSVKDQVVFKAEETGEYNNPKEFDDLEKLVVLSYENAFLKFMSEKKFVSILTGGKIDESHKQDNLSPLKVSFSEKKQGLRIPRDISKLFRGVVTIKAGTTHGSGFFISNSGYILTAGHVVSGLNTVGVVLESGEKLEAKVVRVNRINDAAIIKVDGRNFKIISISMNKHPIGSEVYVIGTPLDKTLEYTVTKGIISSYRESDGVKYIQTDTAINPGNSGGPMISDDGRVIGIISSKMFGTGIENIGFAIPIGEVLKSLHISKENE